MPCEAKEHLSTLGSTARLLARVSTCLRVATGLRHRPVAASAAAAAAWLPPVARTLSSASHLSRRPLESFLSPSPAQPSPAVPSPAIHRDAAALCPPHSSASSSSLLPRALPSPPIPSVPARPQQAECPGAARGVKRSLDSVLTLMLPIIPTSTLSSSRIHI
ncbi:hypothetical protein BDZ91DRAFT_839096 [Kalaharituber pfeilii]|nr:hypothetical protein BDZ91DRAFT_839096 [Kalaharituber pfeilii]